jgi:hypothetical protein
MAFALRSGAAPLRGPPQSQRKAGSAARPRVQRSGAPSTAGRRLAVAAIEQPSTYQPEQPEEAVLSAAVDPSELEHLAVAQLDEAQENLLKWMLFLDADAQEADLDEMVDQEDVGDEEYADLYDEVEGMLEESEASFKVGDKVYGTVYEVDDDGAYVEIGAKTAGFVPLVECSLGKLKTVRAGRGGEGRAGRRAGRRPATAAACRCCRCTAPRRARRRRPPRRRAPRPAAPGGAAPRHEARVRRRGGRGRVRRGHPVARGDGGARRRRAGARRRHTTRRRRREAHWRRRSRHCVGERV